MRLSVDGSALSDPRFKRLAKAIKVGWYEALGRCLAVWLVCYDRRTAVLEAEDVDIIAEVDAFAAALCTAQLAEQIDERTVRVRGVDDRIAFLHKQSEKGKKSAQARASRSAGSTAVEPRLSTGSEVVATYPSALPSPSSPTSPSPVAGAQGARTSKSRKRVSRTLSAEWQPTQEAHALATELGVDVSRESQRFRDHALTNDRHAVDWDAAFRMWLRKGAEFRPSNGVARRDVRTGRVEPHEPAAYGVTREVLL